MPAPLEDTPEEDADVRSIGEGCAELELESGDVVVYDTGNHRAWIQSDAAIDVGSLA